MVEPINYYQFFDLFYKILDLQTHNVAMARPIANFVVSMKNGRVFSRGSASHVLAEDSSMASEAKVDQEAIEKAEDELDAQPAADEIKPTGKLIVAEEIEVGHIGWPACKSHFLIASFCLILTRNSEVVPRRIGRKSFVPVLFGVPGGLDFSTHRHDTADLVSGLLGVTVRQPSCCGRESLLVSPTH